MWNPCEEVTKPSQSWYFPEKKKKKLNFLQNVL